MRYYIPILLLFLIACKEEAQPEVISFEELIGETGPAHQPAGEPGDTAVHLPSSLVRFLSGQLEQYDTTGHKRPHMIDRFGFSTAGKIDFTGRDDQQETGAASGPSLFYYGFRDTLSTKNAFYNWLDCFGNECQAVSLGIDQDELESVPMVVLVYDTLIVATEYHCSFPVSRRNPFRDSLVASFGKNYNYRFEVDCGGPLKWKPSLKN